MKNNWWEIESRISVDTPFLAVYKNRVLDNIATLLLGVPHDADKLRPHVKTHKMGEVLNLFKNVGIKKVKCATIAEAELSAIHNMDDILLAYQLTGEKQNRWIQLIQNYPKNVFSTVVDSSDITEQLSNLAVKNNLILNLYLDLNTGMDRTGFDYKEDWETLVLKIVAFPNIRFFGVHIYDGHIKGSVEERAEKVAEVFHSINKKVKNLEKKMARKLKIVAGGSNTFPFYSQIDNVECSPGTFVFWDTNYQLQLPEQQFVPAAVVVATVISKPTAKTICIDLGYKAVASENALEKRILILNDKSLIPISHSEEHLVLENTGQNSYSIGDIIYALPYHICPTCNLYDTAQIVNEESYISVQWFIEARKRKINF